MSRGFSHHNSTPFHETAEPYTYGIEVGHHEESVGVEVHKVNVVVSLIGPHQIRRTIVGADVITGWARL